METFTLGTAIGLNMTHNASFCAESENAAAWNRARLVEAMLSCFCWYINALMKSTRLENFQREREYGSLAKQVFGSVLFDWDRKGAIYIRRELPTENFEFNWKNNLLAKRVGTNVARATAKTYNYEKRHFNIKFFLQTSLQYFTEMYWNTLLLGFFFWKKKCRNHCFFVPYIVK